jgi:seryl-tRNA synthetase
MIDIKQIRENPERFEKAARDKRIEVDIEELLRLDSVRRDAENRLQEISTEKNSIGKNIPTLTGDEKNKALEKLGQLKKDESAFKTRLDDAIPQFDALMSQVAAPAGDNRCRTRRETGRDAKLFPQR